MIKKGDMLLFGGKLALERLTQKSSGPATIRSP